MKNSFFCTVALIGLACASTSQSAELLAVTPGGRGDMIFAETALQDAGNAVASKCMDAGWMVNSQSDNQIVCEMPMGAVRSIFTQLAIGNSYSTTPKTFMKISLTQVGQNTRAMGQAWSETQMAFGQMQQIYFTDAQSINKIMDFLSASGAQLPVGTTFPNFPFIGILYQPTSFSLKGKSTPGSLVMTVQEGSPGQQAGILVGDIVFRINNKPVKNSDEVFNQLNKSKNNAEYTITVYRNPETINMNVKVEFRPQISQLTMKTVEAENSANPPKEIDKPTVVAAPK